jgi:hypothetical protein
MSNAKSEVVGEWVASANTRSTKKRRKMAI